MKTMLLYLSMIILAIMLPLGSFAAENLTAKITIPYPYSIVRGDVPVYGIACGQGFSKYRLEYGAGEDPKKWELITESDKEQTAEKSKANVDFSLDKTIPGNLGMWDTGLTEYEYGEHKVNLPVGVYVLRLTVIGKNGEKVKDKVQVDVGRVVLNSIGGKVDSPDGQAVFEVPEHALYNAVEVISLKPLKTKSIPMPKEYKLVSAIYELNPPGLMFTQEAILKINYDLKKARDQEQVGIFVLNTETRKWEQLESFLNEKEHVIETHIRNTPAKFVLFCLFKGKGIMNTPKAETRALLTEFTSPVLCLNDFELGLDQWQTKYGAAGAELKLINGGLPRKCLKLTKLNEVGNFGCTVRSQPYNAREYPLISFDYKIPVGLKINFLVKVNNMWRDIVFTDDEKLYWDINMEETGRIQGVKSDNKWHHVEFNLYEMLKGCTNDFIVQEIEMVDWDSTGFMKLEFGQNAKDICFYLDNFQISK